MLNQTIKLYIEFCKFRYNSRERYPGCHDQDVLNFIKQDPFIAEIGINIRFLSTKYFGGICEPSRDFREVCTMHANCCISLPSKVHDLGVMLEDWRKYMSLPPEGKGQMTTHGRSHKTVSKSFCQLGKQNSNLHNLHCYISFIFLSLINILSAKLCQCQCIFGH